MFTQCLRSVYAVFTQCLRRVYAGLLRFTHVYAGFAQCLRSVCLRRFLRFTQVAQVYAGLWFMHFLTLQHLREVQRPLHVPRPAHRPRVRMP